MKMTILKKVLSFMLCFVLIAAMALLASACNDKNDIPSSPSSALDENIVGQGQTEFILKVTFKDGTETAYTVKTDKTTVGEALSDLGLISGTVGQYGLMVETVCGQTVKFETDKMYWAFYVNGDYAMKGIDQTEIDKGATYALKAQK